MLLTYEYITVLTVFRRLGIYLALLFLGAPCFISHAADDNGPQWWHDLDDTLLDSLIDVGLRNNYDIAMAARRIAIARAGVGSARAAYFPTISLSASYAKVQQSGMQSSIAAKAMGYGYWQAGIDMQWELDIFGRITAQVKENKARVRVSRAERDGVELSLIAEIASTYVSLRVGQARLKVANDHLERQQKALDIARVRFETGLASMMDVDQALQVYNSTLASIPGIKNIIHTSLNSLATLLAVTPSDLGHLLDLGEMPGYIGLVPKEIDCATLRQRPDVIEAEENISVSAESLGITKKEWLPKLTLEASVGTESHDAGNLFHKNSITYSVVPTLSWTMFEGMARKYNTEAARLQMENAIDNYNLTLSTAMQEADNALSSYTKGLDEIKALEDVVKASEAYDTRALDNYKSGLSPYINVAQAQMSYLENVNSLLQSKGNALVALINLHKAVGGSFIPSL